MPPHLDLDDIDGYLPPQKSTPWIQSHGWKCQKLSSAVRPPFMVFQRFTRTRDCRVLANRSIQLEKTSFFHLPICAFEMVSQRCRSPVPKSSSLRHFLHHFCVFACLFNEHKQRILERPTFSSVSFALFFGGNVANWHAQETYQKMPTAHENLRRGVCQILSAPS